MSSESPKSTQATPWLSRTQQTVVVIITQQKSQSSDNGYFSIFMDSDKVKVDRSAKKE